MLTNINGISSIIPQTKVIGYKVFATFVTVSKSSELFTKLLEKFTPDLSSVPDI